MRIALFRNFDVALRVTPRDITSDEEYAKKYRGHLFCSEEGCSAQLIWVNRADTPYFRTWPGSKHSADCPNAFETDPSKVVEQATEVFPVRVSAEHRRRALATAIKKSHVDPDAPPVSVSRRPGNNRTRPKTTAGGVRLVATDDPDAPLAKKGTREATIFQRACPQLRPTDHGKYICISGKISRAEVREKSVHFFLASDYATVDIFFYEAFRTASAQAYGWITQIAQLIRSGKLVSLPICCTSVCEVDGNRYSFQAMASDPDFIRIDEKPLSVFYASLPALSPTENAAASWGISVSPQLIV